MNYIEANWAMLDGAKVQFEDFADESYFVYNSTDNYISQILDSNGHKFCPTIRQATGEWHVLVDKEQQEVNKE